MNTALTEMRKDKALIDAFQKMAINPKEVLQKGDMYIYCQNIATENGIALFPVIGRDKISKYQDFTNKDNYELWCDPSSLKIKMRFRSSHAATDISHGIQLIAVSQQTYKRVKKAYTDLIDRAVDITKEFVSSSSIGKERNKMALFSDMFAQINYLYDPKPEREWSTEEHDFISDDVELKEKTMVDYDMVPDWDRDENGYYDWDNNGDGVPDRVQ